MRKDLEKLAARTDGDDPLEALTALTELRREVDRRETVLVRRARVRGASWSAVAIALGVSRQAAHKKHGFGFRGGSSAAE